MDALDAQLCLQLQQLKGLGDVSLNRLFCQFGSAAAIWNSDLHAWPSLGVSAAVVRAARAWQSGSPSLAESDRVAWQLDQLTGIGADVISRSDPRYPPLLATLYDPPPILYTLGDAELLRQPQVGMVGSRRASPPGQRSAQELAAELVRAGLHLTSGLALGIDGAAHRGALEAGGKTIAVMASGLNQIYPAAHQGLSREIIASGCLLTEHPPGIRPLKGQFPRRNRIISGLSLGIVVVEAARRSGSLITARSALEQGREVFALPWSRSHAGGSGCLDLISDGAKLTRDVKDILEELGPLYAFQDTARSPNRPSTEDTRPLSATERTIYELVGAEAMCVDDIVQTTGLAVNTVLSALSSLELQERVARCAEGFIQC